MIENIQNSIILIDKPYKWTSTDVLRKLKKELGIKKLGHAGTLDPLATGLLILASGKYTKRISEFQQMTKEYVATIKLGATTKSDDAEFPEENIKDTSHITLQKIQEIIPQFIGEIEQIPPVFSAVKIKGKRAYNLARKDPEKSGQIKLEPRKVIVHNIEILDFKNPELKLRITSGKGFYVRSLARDIGQKLGTGGYLLNLRRTKIGDFPVEEAITPDELINKLKQ